MGVALAAGSCLTGVAGAAATGTAVSWPSGVPRPAAVSCPRGQTLIAPTSGWRDALGVEHFRYRAAPGLVSTLAPRGLTASRVSAAMISDVGLPSHGVARQLAVRQVLNLARNRVPEEFCESRGLADKFIPSKGPRRPTRVIRFTHTYGSWGGYEVTEAENGKVGINGADGSFTVGQSMTADSPSIESTWVGVGGGGGETGSSWGLIQDGVSMETNDGYRSWFMFAGSSVCTSKYCDPQYSTVDAVHPGDSVTAETWWDSSTEACFYLTNWTTGTGNISTCKASPVPYDHTSAEWVNEYPSGAKNGSFYDNPGTIKFTDQAMTTSLGGGGSWYSPFSGSFQADIMTTGKGTPTGTSCSDAFVLSYPDDAATTSSGGSSQIITCQVLNTDYP
jgi:hypothetical protein